MCWKTGDKTDSLDFILVWYFVPQGETDSLWYSLYSCEFKIFLLLLFECGNKSFINTANSTCTLDALFLHFKPTVLLCSVKVWAVPITK